MKTTYSTIRSYQPNMWTTTVGQSSSIKDDLDTLTEYSTSAFTTSDESGIICKTSVILFIYKLYHKPLKVFYTCIILMIFDTFLQH